MKDLFNPALAEEIEARIMRLRPDSRAEWGSMTVAQTLAHCTAGLRMATGEIRPKRAKFPVNLVGLLIKRLVLNDDKPMRRNSPSAPELFPADPAGCGFESEQARLVTAIDSFVRTSCTEYPHPFFGRLTAQQWGGLMYKHLDHHLRQFGV